MFSALRKQITPATILALMALVFAITGGAFAAAGGSRGNSPAKEKASTGRAASPTAAVAKKKSKSTGARGPAGPKGATGATGALGATGPAGPTGSAGGTGPAGTNGQNGQNGESVTNTVLSKGATCKEGGAEFKVGTGAATHACNGEKGKEGSPWTPNNTLPAGATETGTWGGNVTYETTDIPISFPIPLAKALEGSKVHAINTEEGEKEAKESPAIAKGECKGTYISPGAESGNLCVFVTPGLGNAHEISAIVNFNHSPPELGAGTTGTLLEIPMGDDVHAGEPVLGTWAMTAPEES